MVADQGIVPNHLEELRAGFFTEIKVKKEIVDAIYARLKYAGNPNCSEVQR